MKTEKQSAIFSGMGGVIALVSILFLPVIGCGNDTITGIGILKSNQVAANIKLFLVISMVFATTLIIMRKRLICVITSIGGLISLLVSYAIANSKLESIELKFGAFFAMVGFILSGIMNLFTQSHDTNNSK